MRGGGAAGGVSCDGCPAPSLPPPGAAVVDLTTGWATDDVASWTGFSAFPASLSYNAISADQRDFVISVYEGGKVSD